MEYLINKLIFRQLGQSMRQNWIDVYTIRNDATTP